MTKQNKDIFCELTSNYKCSIFWAMSYQKFYCNFRQLFLQFKPFFFTVVEVTDFCLLYTDKKEEFHWSHSELHATNDIK